MEFQNSKELLETNQFNPYGRLPFQNQLMAVSLTITDSFIKKKHRVFTLCQAQFSEMKSLPKGSSQASAGACRPQSLGTKTPFPDLWPTSFQKPRNPTVQHSFGISQTLTWSSPSAHPLPPSHERKTLTPPGTSSRLTQCLLVVTPGQEVVLTLAFG